MTLAEELALKSKVEDLGRQVKELEHRTPDGCSAIVMAVLLYLLAYLYAECDNRLNNLEHQVITISQEKEGEDK